MNNSKAKYWVGALIVLVIIASIYWAIQAQGNKDTDHVTSADTVMTDANTQPSPEAMTDTSASNTANTNAATPPAKGTGAVKLAYAEALNKYTASRIQLDGNCQAVPKATTYKAGTTIMFDNRAGVARKIMYNLKTYTIAAYDYLLLPATASQYPATTFVDCGDKQNVATITIQK